MLFFFRFFFGVQAIHLFYLFAVGWLTFPSTTGASLSLTPVFSRRVSFVSLRVSPSFVVAAYWS